MEVTEVRVKLVGRRDDKLRAFCTVTLDRCFVVRDLKVISGTRGLFVAMPSRKLTDICPKCGAKNHLRARYCNDCGMRLNPERAERDETGRAKLHADVAHPIHQSYREELQRIVLEAFEEELARSQEPGYRPPHDDYGSGEPGGDDDSDTDEPDGDEDSDDTSTPPPRPPEPPPDSEDEPRTHRFGEGLIP